MAGEVDFMPLWQWAREYLCKRFLIDGSEEVVDLVFQDSQLAALELQDDYAIPEETKDRLVSRLRMAGRAYLEYHRPDAWYCRAFFSDKPGEPT
jgi:hypothetical protein